MQATEIYAAQCEQYNTNSFNLFIHEGGARSSKTTSIIQFLITWAHWQHEPKRVIISRKKNTWTRATTLFDFVHVMVKLGVYNPMFHNISNGILKYRNVEFWFGGLDDPQRIHGFTSDAFWINEANEATKEDFDQLEMRCNGFSIVDYNPNISEDHWLTALPKRADAAFIHSTVMNNPFAPANVVKKIMSYKHTEENYAQGTVDKNKWEIYGLGKRAVIEGLVFPEIFIIPEIPKWIKKRNYGCDFGYTNDYTAIAEVGLTDTEIWIDEKSYLTYQLTGDIVKTFKALPPRKVWSESADPRLLAEISLAGVNIHPAAKPPGSLLAGINAMQGKKIYVTEGSINAIREFRNYTYQQNKDGKWLNVPIDDYNHIIDAVRYVVYMETLGKSQHKHDLTKIFH
jgi:phage terminase large subunit